ncbi:unnamed protein product [Triticum turgidum subsp. durum]|uniref:FLZ-type domain-containing protein n=1 Tax=Triticum turgidum subsp. durum TaxID=4567 RepID=A0A9R1PKC0_TRITD|nr:unnamed protein product [Triticum turgidum subsp. durum]
MPALDACTLYAKRLARDGGVFMHRGDTPFCIKGCRHEQMQLDAVSVRQAARRLQRVSAGAESGRAHHGVSVLS